MIGTHPQRADPMPTPIPWATPGTADEPQPGRSWPPTDWPSAHQLNYTKELITVVLLLIALPWLMVRFARSPRAASASIANRVP